MTKDRIDKIIQQIWSEPMPSGMKVYALLDAARNEKIFPSVTSSGLEWECLYIGAVPIELQKVAPYLIQLHKEDPFVTNLIEDGWEDHWGIFLSAPVELAELKRHLRKFLTVADTDGKQLVFRYYDPRVCRVFLPSCASTDLDEFFGPVHEFLVPGPEFSTALRFRLEEGRLVRQEQPLS